MSLKKYGRTYHLPISPGATSDDKIITDLSDLKAAKEVVVTEKMDGENTTIFAQGCHPRSPDSGYHPSRDWVKAFAAGISPMLSENERIVGEYLFAKHSLGYNRLPSFFLGFAWIMDGVVQDWDATERRFEQLGIQPVPQMFRGPFTDTLPAHLINRLDTNTQEGFVIRSAAAFSEDQMPTHIAKYVRAGHVQSEIHWSKAPLVRNGLA